MQPQYSLVIPVLNSKTTLESTLRCLDAQTFPKADFECIVVDDGSTDGTGEFLANDHSDLNIQVVTHPSTFGRSSSRNTGWQAAHGNIIIFLDGDMLPVPDWLTSYHQAFASTNADVVSGARCHAASHSLGPLSGERGQHPSPLYAALEVQAQQVIQTHPDSVLCAFSVLASNLAIRRTWLDRADGFNPFFARFEDIELGLRLWEANVRFAYAENAIAYHNPSEPYCLQEGWFTAEEMIALFSRHPYRLVLLAGFWGAKLLQSQANGDLEPAETLTSLVERAGEKIASLHEEFLSYYKLPLPVDCRYTLEAVTEVYRQRHLVTETAARNSLLDGISRGLYVEEGQDTLLLDVYHTMNWQGSCSPYREIEGMIKWCNRRRTPYQRSLDPKDAISYQCTGSYEIMLPASLLQDYGGEARINIPLPVEHISQTGVTITSSFPNDLMQWADHGQGMIVRYPVRSADAANIQIRYDFECQLHEFVPHPKGASPEHPSQEMAGYLRTTLPEAYLSSAQTILAQVVPDPAVDAYERARAIYTWAWDNFEFLEVSFPYYYMLRTGFAACVQRMKLCLNLLRLAGIPAREQCGVLFEWGSHTGQPLTLVQKTDGVSPFIHTWVEFYADGHGWTPLTEFASTVRIQSVAIADDHQRKAVHEAGRTMCHTLFGSLDPFRLYGSDVGSRIPTYPLVKSKQGWQAHPEIVSQTAHVVQITLNPIE